MVQQMSHSDPKRYTKPELRDRIKAKVTKGDKGGKPDQWSARKAQLVSNEYEKEGGGYKQERGAQQKSLKQWGDEKWKTEDGKKAERKGGTTRYLPEKAWKSLSKEEKAATNRKKREGSAEGKQFVANTKGAAAARKRASGTKAAAKKSAGTASSKTGARKGGKSEPPTTKATPAAAKKKAAAGAAVKASAKKKVAPARKSAAKKAPAKKRRTAGTS